MSATLLGVVSFIAGFLFVQIMLQLCNIQETFLSFLFKLLKRIWCQNDSNIAKTPVSAVSTPVSAVSTPVSAVSTPVSAVSTPETPPIAVSYANFFQFWSKCVNEIKTSRYYCTISSVKKTTAYGSCSKLENGTQVQICSSKVFFAAIQNWDTVADECVVSFNRGPPETMKLCDIVRKTRQELEFDFDGSHVSYPEKDSRFLMFDQKLAAFVAVRDKLVQRMTKCGLGSQVIDVGPFEDCTAAAAGEAEKRLDSVVSETMKFYKKSGIALVKKCFQYLNSAHVDLPLVYVYGDQKRNITYAWGSGYLHIFAHNTQFPDQVVNGYWIYDQWERHSIADEKLIYIPPNTFESLKFLKKPGSIHFDAAFFVDPETTYVYTCVYPGKHLISGLVELNPRKTATSGVCGEPFTAACRHGQGKNGNWLCSTCGDVVCSSGGQVGCQNCGCADLEDLTFHCFCTEGLQYSDKSSFSAVPLDAAPTTPSTGELQTAEVLEISGETFETTLRKIIDKFEQLLQDFDDF